MKSIGIFQKELIDVFYKKSQQFINSIKQISYDKKP